jgi:hypothetical protein
MTALTGSAGVSPVPGLYKSIAGMRKIGLIFRSHARQEVVPFLHNENWNKSESLELEFWSWNTRNWNFGIWNTELGILNWELECWNWKDESYFLS